MGVHRGYVGILETPKSLESKFSTCKQMPLCISYSVMHSIWCRCLGLSLLKLMWEVRARTSSGNLQKLPSGSQDTPDAEPVEVD